MTYLTRTGWAAVVTVVLLGAAPAAQAQRMMGNRMMAIRPGTPMMARMNGARMNGRQVFANPAAFRRLAMRNAFAFGNLFAGSSAYGGGLSGAYGQGGSGSNSYGSGGYGGGGGGYGGGGGGYGGGGSGGGSGGSSNGYGSDGYSDGSSSSYGNPYESWNYVNPYAESSMGGAASYYQSQTAETESLNVLDAMGVPNADGRLTWPLGLRTLPPDEKTVTLRRQIDALLALAARQSAQGGVNANLVQEAGSAVDELHGLLRKKKDAFTAPFTYNEADRFLDKLAKGLKVLQ